MPGILSSPVGVLSPALMNPNLARQGDAIREAQFQGWIKQLPWYSQFVKRYGEEPDISEKSDYDYRAAFKAGLKPEADPYDGGFHHWPSSTPDGVMLKAADHPTAWKEHYMRATGKNPDAVGATEADWLRMRK